MRTGDYLVMRSSIEPGYYNSGARFVSIVAQRPTLDLALDAARLRRLRRPDGWYWISKVGQPAYRRTKDRR